VNHLADRSDAEIRALRGKQYTSSGKSNGGSPFPYTPEQVSKIVRQVPDSMDWRIAGAVTPVKGWYYPLALITHCHFQTEYMDNKLSARINIRYSDFV